MPTEQWRKANPDKVRAARRKWYVNNREHAKSKVRERQKKLGSWLQEYKSKLKCEKCGNNHPAVLTFHHTNPKEKEIELGQAAHNGWSIKRMLKEITKCQCLCFNCHFILHWNE